MYRLNEDGGVRRLSDNADIPFEGTNRSDWRNYLAWLDKGNEPLPFVKQELVVDENEEKIDAEQRRMAIANLGNELPDGYK